MAIPITVPRLGWSMEEGGFAGWLKADGDIVRIGDPLFVLESDKAAETIEAIDAGILRIAADGPEAGTVVRVGQTLAYLVAEAEAVPAAEPVARLASRPLPRQEAVASPRARRVARALGIDWTRLTGSGRNGRVRERDVRAVATAPAAGEVVPHTPTRRLIAARMLAGVTQAAPVTLTTKVDAVNLVNVREQFRAAGDAAPSYTDLFIKLTAATLVRHPGLRAQWRDDGLFIPPGIHIAFAVDTDAGLLAPIVRDADRSGIREIAAETRQLTELARSGKLGAELMRDATFTVSNLGAFGVDAFTPIVSLPQCAVLGVGRIVREPAVVNDRIEPRDVVTLSLTFDHRVVDGAPAARFLDALRQAIANPVPLLIP